MQHVFISYSHKDEGFKNELVNHLAMLKRNNRITSWSDRKIMPGDEWKDSISNELIKAEIILLLISSDFLSSAYCYDIEMNVALERHENGDAVVVPIFLRYCDWMESPFAKIQGLPKDARPVSDWDDRDAAFMNIIDGIKKILNKKKGNLELEPTPIKKNHILADLAAVKTFEKDGNIFIGFEDDKYTQLTFSKADSCPLLILNCTEVVFIRKTYGNAEHNSVEKLMRVNVSTLFEKTITKEKPYKDGMHSSNFIHDIVNPTLSLDEKYIYFLVEAYVTSGNLVKVNIETGEWIIVSSAMYFDLIKVGQYRGLILIGKSEIKTRARDVYYYLLSEQQGIVKEFDTEENFEDFRKNVISSGL